MSQKINDVEWILGRVLDTRETRRWLDHQREKAERFEERRLYAYFSTVDQGRSRVLICECQSREIALRVKADHDRMLKFNKATPTPNPEEK